MSSTPGRFLRKKKKRTLPPLRRKLQPGITLNYSGLVLHFLFIVRVIVYLHHKTPRGTTRSTTVLKVPQGLFYSLSEVQGPFLEEGSLDCSRIGSFSGGKDHPGRSYLASVKRVNSTTIGLYLFR